MTLDDHVAFLEHTLTEAELQLRHLRLVQQMTRHCLAFLDAVATDNSTRWSVERLAETAPRLLEVWEELRGGKQ